MTRQTLCKALGGALEARFTVALQLDAEVLAESELTVTTLHVRRHRHKGPLRRQSGRGQQGEDDGFAVRHRKLELCH